MLSFNPWILIAIIGIPALYALVMLIIQVVRYFSHPDPDDELIDDPDD